MLELGRPQAADETLEKVLAEFQSLENDCRRMPEDALPAHGRKALLVEDDANESELLAGFLRLSGFTVDRASDGCDALEYLAEQRSARCGVARHADASLRRADHDPGHSQESFLCRAESVCGQRPGSGGHGRDGGTRAASIAGSASR